MSEQPFGIDVSRWQGGINWQTVATHNPKVYFAGIRSGVSWGYEDNMFQVNWAEAKKYKVPRAAYHVVYPDQPVKAQMDKFLSIVGSDHGELPLVLDVELSRGCGKVQISNCVHECIKYLGGDVIVYTRASFVDGFMAKQAWYGNENVYWWLAHYGANGAPREEPPSIPSGVPASQVLIHQYTDNGAPIGVESKALDYNRWQGDTDDFYTFIGQELPEELEEPTFEEQVLEKLDTLIALAGGAK